MQLPICAAIAFLVIIMFALIPKRMTTLDLIFAYFVTVTFNSSSYTFIELNLHSVTAPQKATLLASAEISRIITIPLLIVMAVNSLQVERGKPPQWSVSVLIWCGLVVFDFLLSYFKILTYHNSYTWHAVATPITYLAFITVSWGLTWWYKRYDAKRAGSL